MKRCIGRADEFTSRTGIAQKILVIAIDMTQRPLAPLLYRALEKIMDDTDLRPLVRLDHSYRLLSQIFIAYTEVERFRFTTLFSRMAYVAQRSGMSSTLQYYLHAFRKNTQKALQEGNEPDPQLVDLGFSVISACIAFLWETKVPSELKAKLPAQWPKTHKPVEINAFYSQLRVIITEDDPNLKQFIAQSDDFPGESMQIQYDIADRNDHFGPSIQLIKDVFDWPLTVHLIDVEVDKEGIYRPRAFVIEPDYLMDVTAIAEGFKDMGPLPILHVTRKYLPFQSSNALMLGNIANFLLDELMHDPDASFKAIFPKVFSMNPLAFALLPDRDIREIMGKAQRHFVHLRRVIKQEFAAQGIDPNRCYLEPTFYSARYGIQGRLDVLSHSEKDTHIVELKSGKIYRPNVYGLSVNHFTQTLLYDLMVRTAFGEDTDPQNYILYSGADERQLRFAPVVRAQQMEALQLRNQLLGLEKSFTRLGLPNKEGQSNLLLQSQAFIRQLHPSNHPGARGFIQRDLEQLFQVFDGLPILEKKYLTAFSGFIAREHRLAKVGSEETDGQSGQAALWLSNYQQKDAEFKLLAYLELESNGAEEEEPILTFRKTERTNPLANFRMGDIAVLYPFQEDQSSPLQGQLMKCTLISIDGQRIRIRLRSRQLNTAHFGNFQFWNLEHDLLDSGYNDMYRSLYRFMTFSSDKRDLWLAKKPPRSPKDGELELPADLTTEQQGIFQAILRSEDYFMLWGPPGTGKTSIMLKHLVGYWFDHTDENMVLLAYTNRAVDEICEAIRSYRPGMQQAFLRIGSKYSTAPAFQDNLLTVKTAHIATRKELKQLIRKYRIVVGTVASVVNKPELFSIKSFDRVIIDEASQILEPLLVGLLPQFKHVTLIGDHKQLPAVVVQSPQLSMVDDTDLQEVGLENLRNSLFERLYKQALKNHWDWSYAQLSYQGRMHRDLMMFPNQVFYEGKLKILPKGIPAFTKQIEGIPAIPERLQDDKWVRLIANQRMVFIATPSDHKSVTRKTNAYEAEHVALIIQAFRQWYSLQDRVISIGVITPYRAQIAQIRTTLEAHNLSTVDITIDTVERYQGGARDVIILSLCTNSLQQIQSMMSLSDEGVDRKLNVALTRARKHLIILGNEYLLRQQKIYQQLIDHCAHLD